jgi:hypothetical protein
MIPARAFECQRRLRIRIFIIQIIIALVRQDVQNSNLKKVAPLPTSESGATFNPKTA